MKGKQINAETVEAAWLEKTNIVLRPIFCPRGRACRSFI
jgi:hypothetical protein